MSFTTFMHFRPGRNMPYAGYTTKPWPSDAPHVPSPPLAPRITIAVVITVFFCVFFFLCMHCTACSRRGPRATEDRNG